MLNKICRMIISRARVDKNKKRIYNTNGKVFSILFCILAILLKPSGMLTLPSYALCEREENEPLYIIETVSRGENGVCVTLSSGEYTGLRGFLAEICFDETKLSFVNARIPQSLVDKGFCLSTHRSEGKILVLLDGVEEAGDGQLILIDFAKKEDSANRVTEIGISVTEACFLENGILSRLPDFSSKLRVPFADDGGDGMPPILDAYAVCRDGDEISIKLSGIFPKDCLAVGFEVFAVDLSSYETLAACLSRVVLQNGEVKEVCFSQRLSQSGRICLIVTPISYKAKELRRGEETVIFIENGSAID